MKFLLSKGNDMKEVPPSLLLVGDDRAVNRAKMLLEIHFKHQKTIQTFHKI